jgi:hypothetical protein
MASDPHVMLALIHLVFVVPLFLFIGISRAATPHWLYQALFVIGGIILAYHSWRLVVRLQSRSSAAWVNALHVAIVAPLLLYIGYHQKETPRSAYELLLMLAFAAGGYHLFSVIKLLQVHQETAVN